MKVTKLSILAFLGGALLLDFGNMGTLTGWRFWMVGVTLVLGVKIARTSNNALITPV
jgi:hypothetical protein